MKKIIISVVTILMLSGCYIPSGQYRIVRVEVRSDRQGRWREVSPGVFLPQKVVVIPQRRYRRSHRVRVIDRHYRRRHRRYHSYRTHRRFHDRRTDRRQTNRRRRNRK